MNHALASNQTKQNEIENEKKNNHTQTQLCAEHLIDLAINPKREPIKYVYTIVCFVTHFVFCICCHCKKKIRERTREREKKIAKK